MKKISVMVPCYNEEDNVIPMSEALVSELEKLTQYDYEILFIDNCSQDSTRDKLRGICSANKRIRAIFNSKNFGQFNSPYYGLCQTTGDCAICMCCDFQDPVDMIPRFVEQWERGYKIVCGIKTSSRENKLMYFLRSVYYRLIKRLSRVELIEHFTGFGLYDRSFIDLLGRLGDPTPFLRGIVAELGSHLKLLEYRQEQRRAGKTSNSLLSLYDAAMLSFTSYTKVGVRIATLLGVLMSGGAVLTAVVWAVVKWILSVAHPERYYSFGLWGVMLCVFFVGGLILFCIGALGEYVLTINARVINRPLVVEEERINFE